MRKTLAKAIALTAVLSLISINTSFAGGSIGHGDISILDDQDQVATKLSGQNPIEDGALLVCDGKCMVKSQGISVIADENSKIAVENDPELFKLYIKEGKVAYIINSNSRKIMFDTPSGLYTVAEVVFNASAGSVVKGTVAVKEDGKVEIEVHEGRLVLSTVDGVETVDAKSGIVLAQQGYSPRQGFLGRAFANYPLLTAAGLLGAGIGAGIAIGSSSSDTPASP